MPKQITKIVYYGDYKIVAIDKGTRGLWGSIILHKRNKLGILRKGVGSHSQIFHYRFASNLEDVVNYCQLWVQQYKFGNVSEGDTLPENMLSQVRLMRV